MSTTTSPPVVAGLTLERYAALAALVFHAGRAGASSLLASRGISADAWEEADTVWTAFLADADGEAARVFTTVFAGTRAGLGRRPALVVASDTPDDGDGTGTAMAAAYVPRPVLPFTTLPVDPTAAKSAGSRPWALPFTKPEGSTFTGPPSNAAPVTVSDPARAEVERRLVRFDTQTGEPLPTPYWQDVPASRRG